MPQSYRGDLEIKNEGAGDVNLGSDWTGGVLRLETLGSGNFTVGALTQVKRLSLNGSGTGDFTFDSVSVESFDAELSRGSFTAVKIDTDALDVKSASTGNFTFTDLRARTAASFAFGVNSNSTLTAESIGHA